MSLDGILLNKISNKINDNLPMHINKISSFSNTELCLNVHSNNKRTNLIISMHPEDCHIRLSEKTYNDFIEPNPFIMVLRKYLTNGIIYKIEQFSYDRYLHLYIKNLDEIYDQQEYLLVIELMGKYSNIILVDKNNKIIDAYKKVTPSESAKRIVLPNTTYSPIDPQDKQDPFDNPTVNMEESFVMQLQGFSKLLEKEARYRLSNNSLNEILNEIKNSTNIYINEDAFDFHTIPLTHISSNNTKYDFIKGLDTIYFQKNEKEKIKNVTNNIFKIVNKQLKHEKDKLHKLQESLSKNEDFDLDKNFGDLIFMQENLDIKGKSEITIEGVKIKLDPKLSLKQNANKYYQKYTKKKKGISHFNEQIDILNENINYLEGINEELLIANHLDAEQIKEELINNGYIKSKIKAKSKKKINLYQIKFGNNTITFGKNSVQNNYLTFTYANKKDTFFHAKDYHGSHVIVSGDNLDEKTIRFAANIAAYFSKGRMSSSVPVDYCSVKDIKKIKGSKLGLVSLKNNKTIYIDPEPIDESLILNI